MQLNVLAAQMDVALGRPAENRSKVAAQTADAAARGAQLIVLPELWSTGYDLESAATHASAVGEGDFAFLSALARQHRIYIYGSSLSILGPGRYGNTAVLFDDEGQARATYTKLHLFRPMQEDRFLTAGDDLVLADLPFGRVGLAICYDLRFPEQFRSYALAGARLALLCAEWPNPRLAHWQTLLRARAIENQFFVVACNRVGTSAGTSFFGHSCVLDPWGEVVAEAGEGEELLKARLDLSRVDEVRARLPVLGDRRPEVYGG